MKPISAILTTIAIIIACTIAGAAVDDERFGEGLFMTLQLGTATWAFFDAKKIGMKEYKWRYGGPAGPWSSAIMICFVWGISFPVYLVRRGITLKQNEDRDRMDHPVPQACTGDNIVALERLHSMRTSGVLTEEEFAVQKQFLLEDSATLQSAPESHHAERGWKWLKILMVSFGIFVVVVVALKDEPGTSSRQSEAIPHQPSRRELLGKLAKADSFYRVSGEVQLMTGSLMSAIGKPSRTRKTGDEIWLLYDCTDGTVAIICDANNYQLAQLVTGRVDYW